MNQLLLGACLAVAGATLLLGLVLALSTCCGSLWRGARRLLRRRAPQPASPHPALREASEVEALLAGGRPRAWASTRRVQR